MFPTFILQPPHQVNGSISDAEPFGAASPGISPSTNNNNPDWANNDAFSSAFDGFSSNKLENVSKTDVDTKFLFFYANMKTVIKNKQAFATKLEIFLLLIAQGNDRMNSFHESKLLE